jgi:hypothetical protein
MSRAHSPRVEWIDRAAALMLSLGRRARLAVDAGDAVALGGALQLGGRGLALGGASSGDDHLPALS